MVLTMKYVYQLTLTFFGLGLDYKPILHKEIFYILEHLPGFSWSELYTMPIDLRKFYRNLVIEKIKKHNAAIDEQNRKNKQSSPKNARMPKFK